MLYKPCLATVLLAGLAACAALEIDPLQKREIVEPTAVIEIGQVNGVTTSLPSATAPVNKFLGIPFAKSPPERFMPPEPAAKLKSPLDVKAWKPACIQHFSDPESSRQFIMNITNQPPPKESEDCLYLNVYAPASKPPPGGYPVLYWIYGGSLQTGDASLPTYDGSAFAAYNDVIVVAANYRTNVFGFSNAPQVPVAKHNAGFFDQHLSLDWVQKNIHAFGGCPSKVTIFGESAGGWSVDALLTAPEYTRSKGSAPFRGAIMESGQISYRFPPLSLSKGTDKWTDMAKALGCTSTPNAEQFACVQKAPADKIREIIDKQEKTFLPIMDNATLAANLSSLRPAGEFVKVPILTGTNANEGTLFTPAVTNLTESLEAILGEKGAALIPILEKTFPDGTPTERAAQIVTFTQFQCGAALLVNATRAANVPAWRYYYNVTFPNLNVDNGKYGVYHSSEIPSVFSTYPGGPVVHMTQKPLGLIPSNKPPTAQQEALASYMTSAWARFAKNPTGGPGWNEVGSFDGVDMGVLGIDGSSGVTIAKSSEVDAQCEPILAALKSAM